MPRMCILSNCSKQHMTHRNILTVLVFLPNHFLKILQSKASRLLFIFVHISMCHAHFLNEIRISCEPSVFFSCGTAVYTARNAWFEVRGESLRLVFNPVKKPTLPVNGLLTLSWKYTNIYTHFFQKISRNQACAWFKKWSSHKGLTQT